MKAIIKEASVTKTGPIFLTMVFSQILPLLVFMFFLIPLTFAETIKLSKEAQTILNKAQAEWCPPIDNDQNTFSFGMNPVTTIILGTRGEEAELIDFRKFECSISSGGASGGYPLVIIVNETTYNLGITQSWDLTKVSNIPLLVLFRHGSFCNLPGINLCVQTFTYNQGKLSSPIDWECGIRNDISCYKDNHLNGISDLILHVRP
ncbi:MAG: hypothetical protein P8L82_10490 [Paracoccaceae bacterium]|nr:hypothetical protein [Paracoccaceae bacterium]